MILWLVSQDWCGKTFGMDGKAGIASGDITRYIADYKIELALSGLR